jgi:FkbM family methyltransferase
MKNKLKVIFLFFVVLVTIWRLNSGELVDESTEEEKLIKFNSAKPFKLNKLYFYVKAKDDLLSDYLIHGGRWEQYMLHFFYTIFKKAKLSNPLFIDVGANLGEYSIVLANEGINVIAFEALKKNVESFKKSVKINSLQSKIKIHPFAVSDKEQECRIYSGIKNTADGTIICDTNVVMGSEYQLRETVITKKLEDFLPPKNILAMKIDIEDHEFPAFNGMRTYLSRYCIKYILFELHPNLATEDYWNFWILYGYLLYFDFRMNRLLSKDEFLFGLKKFDTRLNLVAYHQNCVVE